MLNDEELLRYNRQLLLPSWDLAAQEALKRSTVLVIGLGGLGCPVAHGLAMAGVGRLLLMDDDVVELSNLQRQSLHTEARLGQLKVASAAAALADINQHVQLQTLAERASAVTLAPWLGQADVVVDCTDSFASRDAIAKAAWQAGKPLVSAAAIGWQGQLSVFVPDEPASPCYRCVFPDAADGEQRCSEQGVMVSTVAVMGAWQAQEVLKLIAGVGDLAMGQLVLWDGLCNHVRSIRIMRDPGCPVCSRQE